MFSFAPDLSSEELVNKYATKESQFLYAKGVHVHFRDTGEKKSKVVVLLHGFGSSLHTWDEWARVLDKSYRVVRLDIAGFGLSDAPKDLDFSDQADVRRLAQFLDELGIDQFVLVGHSMGGRIAWNFASTYPNRVTRLVLMAPDGFPLPGQSIGQRPYDVGKLADMILLFLPKYLVKKILEPAFYDPANLSNELFNRYYDLLRAPGVRRAILERMRQTINSDPSERLKTIVAPTLLLWGTNDRMIPSSNSKDYERFIPNTQTVLIPQTGHLLQEENPAKGLQAIVQFLEH
jgi:pimeloyl-ACP methyl ester carboxylesterase